MSFEWKGPSFRGFKRKNRGQTGSRYFLLKVGDVIPASYVIVYHFGYLFFEIFDVPGVFCFCIDGFRGDSDSFLARKTSGVKPRESWGYATRMSQEVSKWLVSGL